MASHAGTKRNAYEMKISRISKVCMQKKDKRKSVEFLRLTEHLKIFRKTKASSNHRHKTPKWKTIARRQQQVVKSDFCQEHSHPFPTRVFGNIIASAQPSDAVNDGKTS